MVPPMGLLQIEGGPGLGRRPNRRNQFYAEARGGPYGHKDFVWRGKVWRKVIDILVDCGRFSRGGRLGVKGSVGNRTKKGKKKRKKKKKKKRKRKQKKKTGKQRTTKKKKRKQKKKKNQNQAVCCAGGPSETMS